MAQQPATPTPKPARSPFLTSPLGVLAVGAALLVCGEVSTIISDNYLYAAATDAAAPAVTRPTQVRVWSHIANVFYVAGFVALGVGAIRFALHGPVASPGAAAAGSLAGDDALTLLRSINDRLLISETAKRIAYRASDRDALRHAIREDIEKGDYDAALALVDEMSRTYGYREEAEGYRDQILAEREHSIDAKVTDAIKTLDELLEMAEFEKAHAEAEKIQRMYRESPRVRDLERRVRNAVATYKHDLERRFLEAKERDDVEGAIELIRQMDMYLTEDEARPFRDAAKEVFDKKKEYLSAQFKMAIDDKDWRQAVRVGEQIIHDFPNTRMADEIRGKMLDQLRARAAGQQAAGAQESAT